MTEKDVNARKTEELHCHSCPNCGKIILLDKGTNKLITFDEYLKRNIT